VEVFKAPAKFNGTLPPVVFTPEDESACGLALEKGRDYLLSGSFYSIYSKTLVGREINGTLVSMLCGQILFDEFNKSKANDILLWSEVPKNTVTALRTRAFDTMKCK
jgi:hypothetical protein